MIFFVKLFLNETNLQIIKFEFIVKVFCVLILSFFGSINFFGKESHFKHVNFITIFISNISQHHLTSLQNIPYDHNK